MDPNTHIYFVNKLIIFYIFKFTVSKYKSRLHLGANRSLASSRKALQYCREVTQVAGQHTSGLENKVPAVKPEGP